VPSNPCPAWRSWNPSAPGGLGNNHDKHGNHGGKKLLLEEWLPKLQESHGR